MRERPWNTYYALVRVFRSNSSLRPGCREANRQRSPSRNQSMATSGSQHSAAEPLSKCHNRLCVLGQAQWAISSLDVRRTKEEAEARKCLPYCKFWSNLSPQPPSLPRWSHVGLHATSNIPVRNTNNELRLPLITSCISQSVQSRKYLVYF